VHTELCESCREFENDGIHHHIFLFATSNGIELGVASKQAQWKIEEDVVAVFIICFYHGNPSLTHSRKLSLA